MNERLENLRVAFVNARNELDSINIAIRNADEASRRKPDAERRLVLARSAFLDAAAEAPLSETDTSPIDSDEPVNPQEFKRFHEKSEQRTFADKAREATLRYAESVANAIPETD